ncbi:ORF6N domain-containing protein [Pedobacter steynii]|uniref:ORF6N domain-containing protein n=2 Tax=Pedobacter steynii TaxID=430522 RepID=A0A1G9VWA8_9SPHI|nr:ORF6N domain-containing protein [Pedobacter steynii]
MLRLDLICTKNLIVQDEIIMNQIYYIRGHKVMLDADLAALYEVETKQLKRQVKRNMERFPEDFMFELSPEEYSVSRCQNGTLKQGSNVKYAPMVFTEQGVSMLSSVLNSKRAIQVNIQIIRIFTRIRQIIADNTDVRLEIEKIKNKLDHQDKNMEIVFRYLDELLEKQEQPNPPRTRIGFKPDNL